MKIWKFVLVVLTFWIVLNCSVFANAQGNIYHVGELQFIQHYALDASTLGFEEALTERMTENGDSVEFDLWNAQGDRQICAQAVSSFESNGMDLIFCNSAVPLSIGKSATETVPIIATSVTDYSSALDITLKSDGSTGINVSGTCDAPSPDQLAAQIKELCPACRKVGILYLSDGNNPVYPADIITSFLSDIGLEFSLFPFSSTDDVVPKLLNACNYGDVILFLPANTDSNITTNIIQSSTVPVFINGSFFFSGYLAAYLSVAYYDIGYQAGEMSYDVLVNGADIASMPIQYSPNVSKIFIPELCDKYSLEIPADYIAE